MNSEFWCCVRAKCKCQEVKCFLSSSPHLTSYINIVFHLKISPFRQRPLVLILYVLEGQRTLLSVHFHLSPVYQGPKEHTSLEVLFHFTSALNLL